MAVSSETALVLSAANLEGLRAKGLQVPADGSRAAAEAHIAHIGVGGFHRSHLAFVTDLLMQKQHSEQAAELGERWGILGVGLMPWDKKMQDALSGQDHMYTLLMAGNTSSEVRVLGSILDFIFVPDDPVASLAKLCAPSVRIISLTVTEKGYFRTTSGDLDSSNEMVASDIAAWSAGSGDGIDLPKTAMGLICTVLQRRRTAGLGPLTVLSCDNLPLNGDTCKRVTLQFAKAVSPELASWIEEEVPFPNAMVDRITPATEPRHLALLEEQYGIKDAWPVVAEPFFQWVLEDKFVAGRPKWEAALPSDVLVTSNVEPYEVMKLRLLNSSHSALSYISLLAGCTFVDEALAQPSIQAFLRQYMAEVAATVPEVPGIDLQAYQAKLLERFSNPNVKDTLARLAQDGSQKFYNTLREALLQLMAKSEDTPPPRISLALAGFLRFAVGEDEKKQPTTLQDPLAEDLKAVAQNAYTSEGKAERLESVKSFLRLVFGDEVTAWAAFASLVDEYFSQMLSKGSLALLESP